MELDIVKNYLNNNEKDAWIIYDHGCTNNALVYFIGKKPLSRRTFMVIPLTGMPYIICHGIDVVYLSTTDITSRFSLVTYRTWEELEKILETRISKFSNVIMEISENGSLPKSSYCDYGTVELIKKFVDSIDSSADLLAKFTSTLDGNAYESHVSAMEKIVKIKNSAFKHIEKALKEKRKITEYDVQQYILKKFKREHLVTDSPPIVAVNANAGKPHYEPIKGKSRNIKKGDLILIDLWAKEEMEGSIFADITWMAYAGKEVPEKYKELFDILHESIDEGMNYLNAHLPVRKVCGYEIDDVVRSYITGKGYGDYFIHRTGHSITENNTPHGNGVNIDNYETHDTRHIIPNICFSIEPGIYTDKFGLRSEINVFVEGEKAYPTCPVQESILTMDI